MNRDLFLSILAMDSYNRGYGQGIKFSQSDSNTGVNELGRQLGNATITRQSDVGEDDPGVTAGFYALSYTFSGSQNFADGEKVISYRGTDKISFNPFASDSDVWNGWTLGAGFPDASQVARDFVIPWVTYGLTESNQLLIEAKVGPVLSTDLNQDEVLQIDLPANDNEVVVQECAA